MRKMVVDTSEETRPVWLYDLSLHVCERDEKKLYFRSLMAAGNFLGVEAKHVWTRLCEKHNITSTINGKKYAIRSVSTKSEKSQPMLQIKIKVPHDKTVEELLQESVKILERIRHWSSIKTREGEAKTSQWMERRDEFLASLNIHSVTTDQ